MTQENKIKLVILLHEYAEEIGRQAPNRKQSPIDARMWNSMEKQLFLAITLASLLTESINDEERREWEVEE